MYIFAELYGTSQLGTFWRFNHSLMELWPDQPTVARRRRCNNTAILVTSNHREMHGISEESRYVYVCNLGSFAFIHNYDTTYGSYAEMYFQQCTFAKIYVNKRQAVFNDEQ